MFIALFFFGRCVPPRGEKEASRENCSHALTPENPSDRVICSCALTATSDRARLRFVHCDLLRESRDALTRSPSGSRVGMGRWRGEASAGVAGGGSSMAAAHAEPARGPAGAQGNAQMSGPTVSIGGSLAGPPRARQGRPAGSQGGRQVAGRPRASPPRLWRWNRRGGLSGGGRGFAVGLRRPIDLRRFVALRGAANQHRGALGTPRTGSPPSCHRAVRSGAQVHAFGTSSAGKEKANQTNKENNKQ